MNASFIFSLSSSRSHMEQAELSLLPSLSSSVARNAAIYAFSSSALMPNRSSSWLSVSPSAPLAVMASAQSIEVGEISVSPSDGQLFSRRSASSVTAVFASSVSAAGSAAILSVFLAVISLTAGLPQPPSSIAMASSRHIET